MELGLFSGSECLIRGFALDISVSMIRLSAVLATIGP